ncbi:GAP family protein [Microbacterium schleiferi]|uniref:GAP family protein n=1 Tax=Microbacterium schleiferi TaxID=69362 RepID=UPI001E5D29CE|nr:GAP family protein [Microbacterium schleiferi]
MGWVLGILTLVVLFLVVAAVIPTPVVGGTRPVQGIIHIVIGVLLVAFAARQFRSHARARGASAGLPSWMRAVDRLGFWDALGLGVLLAAVNPKNLLLGAAAGIALGTSGVRVGDAVVVITVYVLVAASTILVPIVGVLIAGDRAHQPLHALRTWLERENAVIMGFVLLILGVVVLSKGIAFF